MSDVSPYGTTQHAGRDGPITANALAGQRAGSATFNAAVEGAAPAAFSTAPYKGAAAKPGARGCYGLNGTCGAPALKGQRYCYFHDESYR